jgi:hypothetical protein
LAEFLHPWCDPTDPGQAPVRIRMIRSNRMAQALERKWTTRQGRPPRPSAVPCVRLDTQTIAFPVLSEQDVLQLVDPVTGCYFIVDGACVDVVATSGETRAQLGLLGLVREAITGCVSARRPIVDLHAAAFAFDDKAVLIAGPKGAGKTSLLCHAITSAGAALLANDRVFLSVDEPRPIACGIPTVVSIRQGTIDAFPQLLARADEFPAVSHIDPSARRTLHGAAPIPPSAPANLLLSPARFAGRLGAARVRRAALWAIVLPELSGDLAGWELERLPGETALARLDSCLYGVAAHRDEPTLFGGLAGHRASGLPPVGERLERLASAVPVYRCRLGRDVYGRSAAPLLRALGLEVSAR